MATAEENQSDLAPSRMHSGVMLEELYERGQIVFRVLGRWIFRAFISMAACFLVTYAGDWTVFHLRGSPTSTVTVERYMGVPLKGQKEEYDYLGPANVSCAVSLFPQDGQDPCWHLRKHPEQWQNL